MTFNTIRRGPEKQVYQSEPEVTNKDEDNSFTVEDLQKQWYAMCQRMPQQMAAMSHRMKNMHPVITTFPDVEVVVDNQILLDQMSTIKKRICATLAKELHNGNITLQLRLAKSNEVSKILSRREVFEKLLKENPAVEQLRSVLDLELT